MCDGFVVRTDSGAEFCIPIYVQVDPFRWFDPNPPDPLGGMVLDLGRLVTINRALVGLRDEGARARVSEALRETGNALAKQLPAGITLGDTVFDLPQQDVTSS